LLDSSRGRAENAESLVFVATLRWNNNKNGFSLVHHPEQSLAFCFCCEFIEVGDGVYVMVIHAHDDVALLKVVGCGAARVDVADNNAVYLWADTQLFAEH